MSGAEEGGSGQIGLPLELFPPHTGKVKDGGRGATSRDLLLRTDHDSTFRSREKGAVTRVVAHPLLPQLGPLCQSVASRRKQSSHSCLRSHPLSFLPPKSRFSLPTLSRLGAPLRPPLILAFDR